MRLSKAFLPTSKDSPSGIVRSTLFSPLLTSPTANSENGAWSVVRHSASAAAIFIGCWLVMIWPCRWPTTLVSIPHTRTTAPATFSVLRCMSRYSPPARRRCQALMASTTPPPVMPAAKTVCGNVTSWVELVSSAQMLVSSARPVRALRW